MNDAFWVSCGEALGEAYSLYALLLLLGCFGVHFFLCWLYVWLRRERSRPVFLELVYALLHPLIYLFVFQPALFRAASPWPFVLLQWLLLIGYWTWRLFGRPVLRAGGRFRGDELLLGAITGVIALIAVRDLTMWLLDPNGPGLLVSSLTALLVAPLYVLPALVALCDWTAARERKESTTEPPLRAAGVALALLFALVVLVNLPTPTRVVRQRVLAVRGSILTVSEQRGLDPRFLAALLVVLQREHGSSVTSRLEEFVAGLWQADATSGLLLAAAFDPPLGIARVKPIAAQTALAIQARSMGETGPGKAYRQVDAEIVRRFAGPAVAHVPVPLNPQWPQKRELVRELIVPESNLRIAGFVVDVLASDWDSKAPDIRIRSRPDLLATLYQLGFERSRPHPDPHPSDFGRRVQAAFDDPWIAEHFAAPRR